MDVAANIIIRGIKYSLIATYRPINTIQIEHLNLFCIKRLTIVRINATIRVETTATFLETEMPSLHKATMTYIIRGRPKQNQSKTRKSHSFLLQLFVNALIAILFLLDVHVLKFLHYPVEVLLQFCVFSMDSA